jgi:hypothetical protein
MHQSFSVLMDSSLPSRVEEVVNMPLRFKLAFRRRYLSPVLTCNFNQGLGLMMAKALEYNGAKKVYIIGRRRETLEAAAKQAVRNHLLHYTIVIYHLLSHPCVPA